MYYEQERIPSVDMKNEKQLFHIMGVRYTEEEYWKEIGPTFLEVL